MEAAHAKEAEEHECRLWAAMANFEGKRAAAKQAGRKLKARNKRLGSTKKERDMLLEECNVVASEQYVALDRLRVAKMQLESEHKEWAEMQQSQGKLGWGQLGWKGRGGRMEGGGDGNGNNKDNDNNA
jgi:hypothetical protein